MTRPTLLETFRFISTQSLPHRAETLEDAQTYALLIKEGLLDGDTLLSPQGLPVDCMVTGITYKGTLEMERLQQIEEERKPLARAKRLSAKVWDLLLALIGGGVIGFILGWLKEG